MAWVSKNPIFFFLQINLFSFCARIEPKLSKLQKTVKIDKRSSKKPCFLIVFRIFSILGSILAQKTTKSKYLSIVPFICHPGHPWSCESSGVITTLISLFKIFQQQRHLVTFFNFPKMKPKITIIDLRLLERSLYAAIFTIVKIARHYIIFWWKYGKSRSQIWHCEGGRYQALGNWVWSTIFPSKKIIIKIVCWSAVCFSTTIRQFKRSCSSIMVV